MAYPVPVPSRVYDGLVTLVENEVCSTRLREYVLAALYRDELATACWIADHPAEFAEGLLYGFCVEGSDGTPVEAIPIHLMTAA